MNEHTSRRRFLKLAGGATAFIPLLSVYGCSDDGPPARNPERDETDRPVRSGEDTGGETGRPGEAADAGAPSSQAAQPVRLNEGEEQARAFGYTHSAQSVDTSEFPAYQDGQSCANCSLFDASQGDAGWGGCRTFGGKLVNADGWCNAYAPRE